MNCRRAYKEGMTHIACCWKFRTKVLMACTEWTLWTFSSDSSDNSKESREAGLHSRSQGLLCTFQGTLRLHYFFWKAYLLSAMPRMSTFKTSEVPRVWAHRIDFSVDGFCPLWPILQRGCKTLTTWVKTTSPPVTWKKYKSSVNKYPKTAVQTISSLDCFNLSRSRLWSPRSLRKFKVEVKQDLVWRIMVRGGRGLRLNWNHYLSSKATSDTYCRTPAALTLQHMNFAEEATAFGRQDSESSLY